MLRKIITWAVVIFVIMYVSTEPGGAGDVVQHAYNGLHDAADSLATFVNSL